MPPSFSLNHTLTPRASSRSCNSLAGPCRSSLPVGLLAKRDGIEEIRPDIDILRQRVLETYRVNVLGSELLRTARFR
jgi:hypothetical protein